MKKIIMFITVLFLILFNKETISQNNYSFIDITGNELFCNIIKIENDNLYYKINGKKKKIKEKYIYSISMDGNIIKSYYNIDKKNEGLNYIWFKENNIQNINKDDLFIKSKMFIITNFKNSQRVIVMEDKELGIIVVSGLLKYSFYDMGITTEYNLFYKFNMTIKIDDNKYSIKIDEVQNVDSYRINTSKSYSNKSIYLPTYEVYEFPNLDHSNIVKIYNPPIRYQSILIMNQIKRDLNNLFKSYNNYIKN
jgi:hypothetical protein